MGRNPWSARVPPDTLVADKEAKKVDEGVGRGPGGPPYHSESMTSQLSDPEHIAISKSKGIEIDWKDGHHSSYGVEYLRDWCPCATCAGTHGTTPRPKTMSAPAAPASPFKMFTAKQRMVEIEPVGSYALRIVWSDGHNTGIYSYDHLRHICPCPECRAKAAV